MARPEVADPRPIFLINHPDLLAELNLAEKGVEKSGLHYYTFEQLKPVLAEIEKQGTQAEQVDDKLRNSFQRQAVKLYNALFHYQLMKSAARPPIWDDFQGELAEFEKSIPAGMAALRARDDAQPYYKAALERFWTPLEQLLSM